MEITIIRGKKLNPWLMFKYGHGNYGVFKDWFLRGWSFGVGFYIVHEITRLYP